MINKIFLLFLFFLSLILIYKIVESKHIEPFKNNTSKNTFKKSVSQKNFLKKSLNKKSKNNTSKKNTSKKSVNQNNTFKKSVSQNNKKKDENEVLNGKTIIVTGATGGIGRELCKKLNNLGVKLIIHGRNQKKLDKLEKELNLFNPHVLSIKADLSVEEDVNQMFDKIKNTYPNVYALVNNASSLNGTRYLSSKEYSDWKKDMTANVDSVFLLSNKLIKHMKSRGSAGRIINVSSYHVKSDNTMFYDGGNIISKNFLEKLSAILSEENYKYNIAVSTLRIDENINSGVFNYVENIPFYGKRAKKALESVSSMLASPPSKVIPVFLYALRAPFHEISGKVISTASYLENPKLSKIVPSHQLLLKSAVYDNLKPARSTRDKNVTYIVKQNPFGVSPKVKELIKNNDLDTKKVNTYTKYTGNLDSIIANKIGVDRKQITFFKTEQDALKKIVELFVPKYQEILALHPCWNYLFMISKEKKINLKYFIHKIEGDLIQPDFSLVKNYINQRTKMLYLSSPDTVTGQSIEKKRFDKLLAKFPDNIPIVIDQSYIEFSNNKEFNPLDYLDKNVIVMRSMNNFYGFENLELAYIISDIDIANLLQKSQLMDMPLNKLNEEIARKAFLDAKYNKFIRKSINKEKKRLYKIFDENDIKYFLSETNYIFINPNKSREVFAHELEKHKMILYASDDKYNSYWTFPIMDKATNDKTVKILLDKM